MKSILFILSKSLIKKRKKKKKEKRDEKKKDCHDITEILLKVVLNIITPNKSKIEKKSFIYLKDA